MQRTSLLPILLTTAALALGASSAPAAPGIGSPFCFGDSTIGVCPCSNPGVPGAGCDNSSATGGAVLTATGIADLFNGTDSLVLTTSGEKPTALSIFLQGDVQISPVPFGQGKRCAGGTLIRFGTQVAVAGTATYPRQGDCQVHLAVQPVSAGGCHAAPGDVTITWGTTRYYQVYYRDPIVLGGCNVSATFNVTNAIPVTW